MKKRLNITAYILILAAITFWLSWFLMPDPGTTDTAHILEIVSQSRNYVFTSVTVQIISSVLYIAVIVVLAQAKFSRNKATTTGLIFLGIGALGLCADAFFHLLAYYMTDSTVTIQQDVILVMDFMQSDALAFLIPLLLPFFIGSLLIAIGLKNEGLITKASKFTFITAFSAIVVAGVVAKVFSYTGNISSLTILGLFAIGQIMIAVELIINFQKKVTLASDRNLEPALQVVKTPYEEPGNKSIL